jgi:hypothetical protein
VSTTVNAEVAGTGDFLSPNLSINMGIAGGGGTDTVDTTVGVMVPFSGAVTDSLVWDGPGRISQVVVQTGAVGSILIEDQILASPAGRTVDTLTTTTSSQTFIVDELVAAGVCLTITGANSGYVLMLES